MEVDGEIVEALYSADSILSLLHYRGIKDTEENRKDIDIAQSKIRSVTERLDKET